MLSCPACIVPIACIGLSIHVLVGVVLYTVAHYGMGGMCSLSCYTGTVIIVRVQRPLIHYTTDSKQYDGVFSLCYLLFFGHDPSLGLTLTHSGIAGMHISW